MTGVEHTLFGDGVMRLSYRGTGAFPSIRLVPPSPVRIPAGADTVSLWVYGNNLPHIPDKNTPQVLIRLHFVDSNSKALTVDLYRVAHKEWFLIQKKLPAERFASGGSFEGMTISGGTNSADRWVEFTSLSVYHEELKPLQYRARAKRPHRIFPNAPVGVNTGEGELDFPNRKLTVVPPTKGTLGVWRLPQEPWDWSDMAFCGPDLVWRRFAVGGGLALASERKGGRPFPTRAGDFSISTNSISPLDVTYRGAVLDDEGRRASDITVRFHEEGLSLVADLFADGGRIEEVRFGASPGIPDDAQVFLVPYYTYEAGAGSSERPRVAQFVLGGEPCFFSATVDWTQSNASVPFCQQTMFDDSIQVNGGVRYNIRTDGCRNPCVERFVWTFSREFADVLPMIPNPPSPYRALTAECEWCHMAAGDRDKDKEYWRDRKRRRLDRIMIGDHEVCMRDGNESFTFRTRPAPAKGGDAGMQDFTRYMIDGLGYLYGLYNNYTDFAPVNGYWNADRVSRWWDGNLQRAWNRCYAPKPVWAIEASEEIVPVLQGKFGFNSGYCDVHTCVSPWSRCDYDARVPGAGTFAQTFYAYGELLELQRRHWNGPVYSEGGVHFLYAGLDDGNFAQDVGARLDINPWLVDFDLLRIHPLCNNFGMGYPNMFYPRDGMPRDHEFMMDRFLAATIAFGHIGYFMTGNPDDEERGYWMVQPIAAHYAKSDVRKIRYADERGIFADSSAAIASRSYERSQIAVRYADRTKVIVNGNADGEWLVVERGNGVLALPPNGWCAVSGDGTVASLSALTVGGRVDVCAAPNSFYLDGRGNWFDSGRGATDGRMIRVFDSPGVEEVFVRHAKEVELPYASERVVCLDRAGCEVGLAQISNACGRTRMKVDPFAYSYRAYHSKEWREPSPEGLLDVFLLPQSHPIPKVKKVQRGFSLPDQFIVGEAFRGGEEHPLGGTSGAEVRQSTLVVGGVARTGLFMHPPYKGGTGYVFARWKLSLPDDPLVFKVEVGKIDGSSTGDGTLYRIELIDENGRHVLAEFQTNEHKWKPLVADLSAWKGRTVRLLLVADCGRADNHVADHSAWANMGFERR